MATILRGTWAWGGERDAEGHRSYTVVHRVEGTANDGPASVLTTPGLPIPGQMWAFGGDIDIWAWCRYETELQPELEGEPNYFWKVTNHFSTKPPEGRARSHDPNTTREDPLLEPPKISGGFSKKTKEITHDRFGRAICTSSHEQIRGPEVEFDESQPTVTIEFNTLLLNLPLYSRMRDTVNDRTLWGMPKRTVRLADVSWERRYWANSFVYYSVKYVFEANARGWDRTLLDEGTKALNGRWTTTGERTWELVNIDGSPPNHRNPAHFIRFKDPQGENARVILDGFGKPYVPVETTDCSECSGGAPLDWIVSGLPLGDVRLQHQGGCEWSLVQNTVENGSFEGTILLEFDNSIPNWVLTITHVTILGATVDVYTFDPKTPAFWACFGSNRMTLQIESGVGWPDEIFISSGERALPGKIIVEHYRESNFYLLGIPAVLG